MAMLNTLKWQTVLIWSSVLLNLLLIALLVFGVGRFLRPPPPPSATHFISHIARDLNPDQRAQFEAIVDPYLPTLKAHQDAFMQNVKHAAALMQAETVDINQFKTAQQAAWNTRQDISQIMQKLTQDLAEKLPTDARQALKLGPPK